MFWMMPGLDAGRRSRLMRLMFWQLRKRTAIRALILSCRQEQIEFRNQKNKRARFQAGLLFADYRGLDRSLRAKLVESAGEFLGDALGGIVLDDEALHQVDELAVTENGNRR